MGSFRVFGMGHQVFSQMESIEQRFAQAMLGMIRSRREALVTKATSVPVDSSRYVAPVRLREAAFSDFEAVSELKQRWGLNADSTENWERLWLRNPALACGATARPIGWVLEADEAVVGYLGNISLSYRYGDRKLTAVAAHGLVVDPPYRNVGLTLTAAFFRQKSVDLYLTTSAIEAVGRMALAFKSSYLPQPDYGKVLFWVLQPYAFSQALMKKLQLGQEISKIGSVFASLALGTNKTLGRRWPRQSSSPFLVNEISIDEIGDDFQALWLQKLNEKPRLLAERSAAALRWHFGIPGDRGLARVLCCHENRDLVGYAVIRTDTDQETGLRTSIIADLLARNDDLEIVKALCVAAHDHARDIGSHVLELVGFPPAIRNVCSQWGPYTRAYPACPFLYKAADPALQRTLSDGLAWYASPFDGDTTLIRPSYSSASLPSTSRVQTTGQGDTSVGVPEHTASRVF
jgi:hypothetical protein